jgi:hypothetical protein
MWLGTVKEVLDEVRLNTTAERYRCPKCTWEFAFRKKRRCPTCGTLLLILSDKISDNGIWRPRQLLDMGPCKAEVGLHPRLGGAQAGGHRKI